jgi:hypothetical protein
MRIVIFGHSRRTSLPSHAKFSGQPYSIVVCNERPLILQANFGTRDHEQWRPTNRVSRAVGAKPVGHFDRTSSNFMNENSKSAESQYTRQPHCEPACFRSTSLSRMMGFGHP